MGSRPHGGPAPTAVPPHSEDGAGPGEMLSGCGNRP